MANDDYKDIELLHKYSERFNEATDKNKYKNVEDYRKIISMTKSNSLKARRLAAQVIPRFFKFFPKLFDTAVDAHLDLCEEEDLEVRVQAIRGLPLYCKEAPKFLSKIIDTLVQLLKAEENVERDAVQKALLSLLRQDVKASLTALFTHIENMDEPTTDENVRQRTLCFIQEMVFPHRNELLKPQDQMERHITELIKKSLKNVREAEFKMFMGFLKSLNMFGEKAPPERVQELIEFIEGQADLGAKFNVTDADRIDRLISCMFMALPVFMRGASNSKFLGYLNEHILPVFDELPEEQKIDLLKNLAECSPYTAPEDCCQLLIFVIQLLKKCMPRRKSGEELNFAYVECLLYTFHHVAPKTPDATKDLCGYKVFTVEKSTRSGKYLTKLYNEFTQRLRTIEVLAIANHEKLTQRMTEHNTAMSSAKTDEAKATIKAQKQNTTTGLRAIDNILSMTQPLHGTSPSFIGDNKINLSWKEAVQTAPSTATAAGVNSVMWTRCEFSQKLKDRESFWKGKRRLDLENKKEVTVCIDEYKLLSDSFAYEDLDDEVFKICINESNLCFMILILYMGNVFNTSTTTQQCTLTPEFKKSERLRLLLSKVQINSEFIELMVEVASRLTTPRPHYSHMESAKMCIKYAHNWTHGHPSPIFESSTTTYEALKKTVTEIVGSTFFRSIRPSLGKERNSDEVPTKKKTLATWLKRNPHRILEHVEVEGNHLTKGIRLSQQVRLILRGILRELQQNHQKYLLVKSFTMDDIYLSNNLEVNFQVHLARGLKFFDDFRYIKELIKGILQHASPSSIEYPKDVEHFMDLIDAANEETRTTLYVHPITWSDCEVIKNVYLLCGIYSSSSTELRYIIWEETIKMKAYSEWRKRIPYGSIYKTFINSGWSKIRQYVPEPLLVLYYMRDSYSHIHPHEADKKRCLYKTERELYVLFPRYLPEFVQFTCEVEAFSGLFFAHTVNSERMSWVGPAPKPWKESNRKSSKESDKESGWGYFPD